jgi:hypothetical protein
MNVRIWFVPPGGGEADYGLDLKTDFAPRVGEYMTLKFTDREQPYYGAFRVLFVSHEGEAIGETEMRVNKMEVQLEPVRHGYVIEGPWFDQLQGREQNPRSRDAIKDYPGSGY